MDLKTQFNTDKLGLEKKTDKASKKISDTSGLSKITNFEGKIPTISFIILWDFSMFYQNFFSPQVKRWVIINYKHGIYQLPYQLPNDLRLRKLGNIRKVSKFYRMIV